MTDLPESLTEMKLKEEMERRGIFWTPTHLSPDTATRFRAEKDVRSVCLFASCCGVLCGYIMTVWFNSLWCVCVCVLQVRGARRRVSHMPGHMGLQGFCSVCLEESKHIWNTHKHTSNIGPKCCCWWHHLINTLNPHGDQKGKNDPRLTMHCFAINMPYSILQDIKTNNHHTVCTYICIITHKITQ